MRKSELIKENQNLRIENKLLRDAITGYKQLLRTTRDCYGEKLMELEQQRLLLAHPDILVDDIEWSQTDIIDPKPARYKFVYSIKGEKQ